MEDQKITLESFQQQCDDALSIVSEIVETLTKTVLPEIQDLSDETGERVRSFFKVLESFGDSLTETLRDEKGNDLVRKFDSTMEEFQKMGRFTNVERITKVITRDGAGRKPLSEAEKAASLISKF